MVMVVTSSFDAAACVLPAALSVPALCEALLSVVDPHPARVVTAIAVASPVANNFLIFIHFFSLRRSSLMMNSL